MINGIINVYKEKGYTSHDVVAKLRGILKQKKIGHTGTLDPDATGVLPVCLGRGTRLCDMLTDKDKTYRAIMKLGVVTDTQDSSGTILEEKDISGLEESIVKKAVLSYVGGYDQIPPMYSALKVNGKKLYELAREGIEIERKARRVEIYDIVIEEIQLPYVTMVVTCSKGTYIRTLCHDIGTSLNVGACMDKLERTRVSIFNIEESLRLEEIESIKNEGRLEDIVIRVDEMFSKYPSIMVKEEFSKLLYNGNPFAKINILNVQNNTQSDNKMYKVYDYRNVFIGIYEEDNNEIYKVVKFFYEN